MINITNIKDKKIIIYGFGIAGKWLSSNINSEFIIDTDAKKVGKKFGHSVVYSPLKLNEIDVNDYLVLVTVVDIFDVIPILNQYAANWMPLSSVVDKGEFTIGKNETTESDEFLQYSINTVLECQKAALDEETFYLRSVDLVITEKCTLKCKDCANLMQYYTLPINYTTFDIMQGIKNLAQKASFIHEVRIIGGEPFLNKNIYDIIEGVLEIANINKIVIYTNGMIPPNKDRLATLNKDKVLFSITDYAELGRNLRKTIDILDEYRLPYRVHPPEHWTDSGRILEKTGDVEEAKLLFAKCCGKNLYTAIGQKLYRCPFAANADQLKAIPDNPNNYVNVTDSSKRIRDFAYGLTYIDACMYCPGRSFDSPIITPALQTKEPIQYKKYIPIEQTRSGLRPASQYLSPP